jgi:hypothetical protein
MGEAIPPNTTLTANNWAANRSALNFHVPDEMVPERWIHPRPTEYQDEDRAAMKPFSFGPSDRRNVPVESESRVPVRFLLAWKLILKSFAWAEARLVLAHMLWSLDLELVSLSDDWMACQRVFTFWTKPPLEVRCKPVQRLSEQEGLIR